MGKYPNSSKINCFLNGMGMTSTLALFLMMVGVINKGFLKYQPIYVIQNLSFLECANPNR
jgi:hypothetical protein